MNTSISYYKFCINSKCYEDVFLFLFNVMCCTTLCTVIEVVHITKRQTARIITYMCCSSPGMTVWPVTCMPCTIRTPFSHINSFNITKGILEKCVFRPEPTLIWTHNKRLIGFNVPMTFELKKQLFWREDKCKFDCWKNEQETFCYGCLMPSLLVPFTKRTLTALKSTSGLLRG